MTMPVPRSGCPYILMRINTGSRTRCSAQNLADLMLVSRASQARWLPRCVNVTCGKILQDSNQTVLQLSHAVSTRMGKTVNLC